VDVFIIYLIEPLATRLYPWNFIPYHVTPVTPVTVSLRTGIAIEARTVRNRSSFEYKFVPYHLLLLLRVRSASSSYFTK